MRGFTPAFRRRFTGSSSFLSDLLRGHEPISPGRGTRAARCRPGALTRRFLGTLACLATFAASAEVTSTPLQTFGLGEVLRVALSPDGRYVATSGRSGAYVWDFNSGQLLHRLEAHEWGVAALAFSPDSRLLLTGAEDRFIRAWDVETGAARGLFEGHTRAIQNLEFAPDGRSFVAASLDSTVRVWSLETSKIIQQFAVPEVQLARFSPDGRQLVTSAIARADQIQIWDVETGKVMRALPDHAFYSSWLGFVSEDVLISVGDDLKLRIWNLDSGELLHTLSGATLSIAGVSISPDGRTVAAGCQNGRMLRWNVATGELLAEVQGPWMLAMCPGPDSGRFLSTGADNLVRLIDGSSGATLRRFEGHNTSVTLGVAFSPDGSKVLSGGGEAAVRLWDRATGRPIRSFEAHGGGTATAVFANDGRNVLTTRGAPQPAAELWDTETGQLVRPFAWTSGWPMCAALSKDGLQLATGAQDGRVRVWEVQSGTVTRNLPGPASWVTAVAWSPDGRWLAAGGDVTTPVVQVWDLEKGTIAHAIEENAGSVKAIAFAAAGDEFLAAWEDGYLRRFDTQTGKPRGEIIAPAAFLNAAVYSPDDRFILTGEGWPFFTARLWDKATGTELRVFAGHKGPVNSVAFAPTGTHVLTGSDTVRLWDLRDLASRLVATRRPDGMELSWGVGKLQRQEAMGEPWSDLEQATSPWMVPLDQSSGFYRVRVPDLP